VHSLSMANPRFWRQAVLSPTYVQVVPGEVFPEIKELQVSAISVPVLLLALFLPSEKQPGSCIGSDAGGWGLECNGLLATVETRDTLCALALQQTLHSLMDFISNCANRVE